MDSGSDITILQQGLLERVIPDISYPLPKSDVPFITTFSLPLVIIR